MRFSASFARFVAFAALSSGIANRKTPVLVRGSSLVSPVPPSSLQKCKVSALIHKKRDGLDRWYANSDRTIWAFFWTDLNDKTPWCCAYVGDNKVWWIRPAPFPDLSFNEGTWLLGHGKKGREFTVTGRRLDAPAPPLRFSVPGVYAQGSQASNLHFPTEGCWEVTAKSGPSILRFVTEVRSPLPSHESPKN